MNIFFRELKSNVRSLLIWAGIVILFNTIGFSKFSAYADNPELLAILDGMPPALLAAFNLNAFNLTTVTGFLGVMFSYFALLLSIAAVMWGTDIITKEERDKTVEFALTLPVPRRRLISAKALAALVNNILLLLITFGVTWANAAQYQPDDQFYGFLNRVIVAFFILQLIFLAIGIFLGCALKRHKRASSTAVSILLGTYFLSIVVDLNKDWESLKFLSPFKYFNPVELMRETSFDPLYIALATGIVVISMTGAYLTYARRDLYI